MRCLVKCCAMLLVLVGANVALGQESKVVDAALSWSGHGQVFQIGIDQQEFLGMFEGVLYVETSDGALTIVRLTRHVAGGSNNEE